MDELNTGAPTKADGLTAVIGIGLGLLAHSLLSDSERLSSHSEPSRDSEEKTTPMLPSSPILYDTSSGSIHKVNSAGKISSRVLSLSPQQRPALDSNGSSLFLTIRKHL